MKVKTKLSIKFGLSQLALGWAIIILMATPIGLSLASILVVVAMMAAMYWNKSIATYMYDLGEQVGMSRNPTEIIVINIKTGERIENAGILAYDLTTFEPLSDAAIALDFVPEEG